MSVTTCLILHLGTQSPIAAYRRDMAGDVEDLVAEGMTTEAAWLKVAGDKLAELTAERTRIKQVVADAYAKTAAGMREATKIAESQAVVEPEPEPEPAPPPKSEFFGKTEVNTRRIAEDAEMQQAWLDDQAKAMGYRDIDQLVDRDFDGFMALAEQWRESNPAEVMMSRGPRQDLGGRRKDTPAEVSAAKAALARIEAAGGVTSPDDLRDILRVSGYSQWTRSPLAGDVDGASALRAELAERFPGNDWRRPGLNQQGVISVTGQLPEADLTDLAAIADKYDAPVIIRGFRPLDILRGESASHQRLLDAGFETYAGMQESIGTNRNESRITYIRPAGNISRVTPLFSRAPAPNTPAFRKWFGDSVVTENGKAGGKPLMVYHGTFSDFSKFSDRKLGENTDGNASSEPYAQTSRVGFWFNTKPMAGKNSSAGYALDMPVYLSIKNPRREMSLDWLAQGLESTKGRTYRKRLIEAGYDGIVLSDEEFGGTSYIVFRPEQIKSAIGNRGTFDPANPDIRMARTPSRFALPEFGMAGQTIEKLQDRYNRWKQTIDAIREQGGVVSEASDFYRAEERYWGKVASRIEDFDAELRDFIKAVAADGVTLQDVQDYAYAMHAKERNEYLRTKRAANPTTGFDSWSGMTDDDAQAIIDDAQQSGMQPVLERHRQTLKGWIQGTRDILMDEGLITPYQWLMLNAAYDEYVPLRGKPGKKDTKRGTGRGFDIRGKETERARGRYSEADNIIEYIIQDRVKALTRAGKNEVMRSFLKFVEDNPDPTLWEINAVETRPVMTVDDQGNQIIEEQRAVVKDDRTVGIKDGGREVFVKINDEKLLEQLKNLNAEEMNVVLGYMLAAQRALGRMYTSLNPVFTVLNFSRDLQASTLGMMDETGFRGAAKLAANVPRSMVEAWRAEFGTPSPDYQLFRSTGGKTGFMDFKDIDTQAKDLRKRLARAEMSNWNPIIWGPAALDFIESLNAGIENGVRFAAWQAARSEGKKPAQASSISKNISVNFNRKGTWTPTMSAWFLFFNPAVQGTARVLQAIKSPKVLATLGAAMTGTALLALQNASMGEDDDGIPWWDKIPHEVKDRNLVILFAADPKDTEPAGSAVPGSRIGRYIKIPLPYGFNWFLTIANQAVDVWRHAINPAHGSTPAKAALRTATSFLGAYMPAQELARSIENSQSAVAALAPDFINAPVQALMNVNAFGRQMYPEDRFSENMPDSSKYFAGQAGTIFQRTAEGMNAATGGSKYESGLIDLTPATVEALVRAYGGGPASFTLDIMNAMYVRQNIERPDVDWRRMPFAKQLYGRIDAETDRMLSYERMDRVSEVVDRVDKARRDGNIEDAKRMRDEAPELYRLGGALKVTRDRLGELRKQELAIIASDESEGSKFAKLTALNGQKRRVLQDMNRAFNASMRAEEKLPQ